MERSLILKSKKTHNRSFFLWYKISIKNQTKIVNLKNDLFVIFSMFFTSILKTVNYWLYWHIFHWLEDIDSAIIIM